MRSSRLYLAKLWLLSSVFLKLDDALRKEFCPEKFEEQWTNCKVDGWKDKAQENEYVREQNTPVDLDDYGRVDELVEPGTKYLNEDSRIQPQRFQNIWWETLSLVDSEAEQEKKPETHAEHSGIAFPSRRRIVLSLAQLNEATTTLVVILRDLGSVWYEGMEGGME
ncbi:hypothetical protein HanRHA438_Chr01g0023831 [Helianthus annuus]|uniref:Uncharacterized protein n=1 Tax=Helianthus annuus TaxID=4232 RepID=A0A9K3P4L9_HELAN|nr:hypothetical protein HanXRQr2_Chr01g0023251 [Helianthus annuus]KAJ0948136.1 hypothetical protein HanRHA438_Chr01g0023831 [Helianthus annuus]